MPITFKQSLDDIAQREVLQRQIDATNQQIGALVYELYGLSEAVVEG
jgi:hypothetical protein